MPWLQIKLRIAATELARTEAMLGLAGAEAIAISDAADTPIHEPLPGTTPLWPALEVTALFDARHDPTATAAVFAPLSAAPVATKIVDDAAIERGLRQVVEPLEIGPRLSLAPAGDAAGRHRLRLHMGLAFGTGRHATTRLCLEWLEQHGAPFAEVLDYGCGSGVLALAALRLGAERATAIDIEPQALEATLANARLNGFGHAVRVGGPDAVGEEPFGLVLANVLAEPLIELAPTFARLQLPGGRLLLSGILDTQCDAMTSAYAPWYEDFETREREGWALLTGLRRSGYDR